MFILRLLNLLMLITKHQILGAFLCLCSFILSAQNLSITGKVVDQSNEPLSFVNVVLKLSSDSSVVKGTITNDNGIFNLNALSNKDYIIEFSFIGFKTVSLPVKLNGNVNLKQIILNEDAQSLEEVTVVAKKPTIKRAADRLTFNIANTALSEGNMLSALRSTPGVLVMDGNLSVKGSEPTVYINNRKVNLSSQELSQLLSSTSANSISSIEVITNPSARYDAESGTVISITMSKNLITGYRGSVFTNYAQGVFPRYEAGLSQSFKNKNISLTANYTFNKQKINRDTQDEIRYFEGNAVDEIWQSDLNRNTWSDTHNLNLNFDWYINEKSTLSFTNSTLYLPYFKYKLDNETQLFSVNQSFLGRFTSDNLSRDEKYNIAFDLGLNHQFNSALSLFVNAHFTTYDYNRGQSVFSEFFNAGNVFERASEFKTNANQGTQLFNTKADLSWFISDNQVLESGIKFSNVSTSSDINQFDIDLNTGEPVFNPLNSDAFDYDENVFAAYANYNLDIKKWNLTFGLRAEQTNIDAISQSTNQLNTQDYLEWFPNASITHYVSDSFSLYGNYKRSLTRPNYTSLNPFNFFLNENTVVTGNPSLIPTFVDHFWIGTSFLDIFTIEAYYKNYDGSIVELPRQNNVTNILEYTYINLDNTVDFGFDFAVDFNLTDNWNVYAVASIYNWSEETKINDDFIEIDRWSNYSILSNNLSLLEDNSLNINLDLTWVGKNVQALQTVEDRLFSSLAISKSLFNKKAVLSLAVEDLFIFQDEEYTTQYLNQFSSSIVDLDNRYVRLGFRYKFGNTTLETNTKELTEEEEKDRGRLNSASKNN